MQVDSSQAWGNGKVVDAAAGCYHSVALAEPDPQTSTAHTPGPRVYTWGLNNYGQLARNSLDRVPERIPRDPTDDHYNTGVPAPVEMPQSPSGRAPPQVRGIGSAFYNTFVLMHEAGALCAGSNQAGQCGTAAGTHSGLKPIPELAKTRLSKILGGYCHTMALTEDGKVLTLGCGEDGQRGDGRPPDTEDWSGLSQVNTGKDRISQIAAGANHVSVSLTPCTIDGNGKACRRCE